MLFRLFFFRMADELMLTTEFAPKRLVHQSAQEQEEWHFDMTKSEPINETAMKEPMANALKDEDERLNLVVALLQNAVVAAAATHFGDAR